MLCFCGGVGRGASELQFVGDTKYVCVYSDAFDNAECLIEHHICGLAPYSGKLLHLVHVAGNFATEIRHDHLRAGDAVFCFGAVKPN